MKKQKLLILISGIVLGIGCILIAQDQSKTKPQKELLRVGVYDSRAIAAVYNSKYRKETLKKDQEDLVQAQQENNIQKIKEILTRRQQTELISNLQGLGIESAHECLEPVRDKILAIVKEAGVDILINKWSMDYTSENAGFIDLTDKLVKLYEPTKADLQWLESLKKTKPVNQKLN